MRKSTHFVIILTALLLWGCGNQEYETPDTTTALESNIDSFQRSFRTDLRQLGSELDAVSDQLSQSGEDVADDVQTRLTDLRSQFDKLDEDISDLQAQSEQVLDRQKEAMSMRLSNLKEEIDTIHFNAIEPRPAYQDALSARLDSLDDRIARLEGLLQNEDIASTDASPEELQSRLDAVGERAEELMEASDEEFASMRDSVTVAVARLDAEVSALVTRLKTSMNSSDAADETAS